MEVDRALGKGDLANGDCYTWMKRIENSTRDLMTDRGMLYH